MDPTYPLAPVANLVACILALLSLLTGFTRRSRNVGVMSFAIWVMVMSLTTAINEFVWSDSSTVKLEVWCDIVSHIAIGSTIGVPACSFVIARKLFKITDLRQNIQSRRERNIDLCIDLGFCMGLPILEMALYYIVQGARFQVWEEIGCLNAINSSILSILLINVLPVLLPAFSALFYCPRILWTFYRHRKEANEFLSSTRSMGRKNYFRLLILGCVDAIVLFPAQTLNFVIDLQGIRQSGDAGFYPGWTLVHSDWAPVSVPENAWNISIWFAFSVRWSQWINPFFGLLFFLLFGVTTEARESYKRMFWAAANCFGYTPPVQTRSSNIVFKFVVSDTVNSERLEEEKGSRLSGPRKLDQLDTEKGLAQACIQDEAFLQDS